MRIQRVIARAFGPFRDAELNFARGMTVVVGPNEAGKSSWHAATRLAITGVRRGRGRATAADAAVEARHRPWDAPERWEVEARLLLADERLIDISQDLAGKVACRAVDVALGRDVSDEILDGTPDASIWLGLDRESFAATVSVSQAQIASVANAETAELLQEHMQRAAATRGTDATAAEAIDRLTEFRRQAVGADTVAAKGPLRLAKTAVAGATARLEEAREMHARYLERAAAAESAEVQLAEARGRLAVAEASAASRAVAVATARLQRAEELAGKYPHEPAGLSELGAQADQLVAALESWQHRPRPIELDGASAADIERAIAALPPRPDGDTRPHPTVTDALRAVDLAEESLRLHGEQAPVPSASPAAPEPARTLARSGLAPALLASLLLVAVGGVMVAAGVLGGVALVGAGLVVAGIAWWRTRAAPASDSRAADLLRAQLAQEGLAAWEARGIEITRRVAAGRAAVSEALQARGAPAEHDPRAAVADYLAACERRAAQAMEAGRRESLTRELQARRAAEDSAAQAASTAEQALTSLRAAVLAIGGNAAGAPEELVAILGHWREERAAASRRAERAAAEWQELRALLGTGTLDDLRADVERQAERAAQLAASLDARLPESAPAIDDVGLAKLRAALSDAQQRAADLAGGLREVRSSLPDVAEAEEAQAAAEAELGRVEGLATTVDISLRLLRAAEDRVHRDLAPILAESVRRWLPVVSRGAYHEVSVDPADLSVRVKEATSGQWRDARLLSEGTREQIYLLLRVAMAQHLVKPGEVAPLLLDEVTAQSDGARKRELLDVLHELSRERQVILFSHDDDVAAWTAQALVEPRDSVVHLPPLVGDASASAAAPDGMTLIPVG